MKILAIKACENEYKIQRNGGMKDLTTIDDDVTNKDLTSLVFFAWRSGNSSRMSVAATLSQSA